MSLISKYYFLDLFHKQNIVAAIAISVVHQTISTNDNFLLTTPFTNEEF